MQRTGLVLVMFILAVGISVGISFFLWGQPRSVNGSSADAARLDILQTRVNVLQEELDAVSTRQADLGESCADFEILLTRLDMLERRARELSGPDLASRDVADPEARELLARTAEEKAREVYKDMKEEERRKQEEEWRRRQEERWQETQGWLVSVYNERLALLTKELSLTPNQEAGVREALEVRKEAALKVYARWQLPEDQRPAGDVPSWDDIRKTFDDSVKQVFDQQQYKTYKDKRLDDFNRGRGRGRGR